MMQLQSRIRAKNEKKEVSVNGSAAEEIFSFVHITH